MSSPAILSPLPEPFHSSLIVGLFEISFHSLVFLRVIEYPLGFFSSDSPSPSTLPKSNAKDFPTASALVVPSPASVQSL